MVPDIQRGPGLGKDLLNVGNASDFIFLPQKTIKRTELLGCICFYQRLQRRQSKAGYDKRGISGGSVCFVSTGCITAGRSKRECARTVGLLSTHVCRFGERRLALLGSQDRETIALQKTL